MHRGTFAKRVGLLLLALLALAVTFLLGGYAGVRTERETQKMYLESISSLNALAQYRSSSEIARHLRNGRNEQAQCTAEIVASIVVAEVRHCLANGSCRPLVLEAIQREHPELLSPNAELGFRIYASGEKCNS